MIWRRKLLGLTVSAAEAGDLLSVELMRLILDV